MDEAVIKQIQRGFPERDMKRFQRDAHTDIQQRVRQQTDPGT